MNCGYDEIPDNGTLCSIAFVSKSLLIDDLCYSNMEWEALGILHCWVRFPHYCFAKEVCIITDHKPLVVIISKEVAMVSHCLQCNMLLTHQYQLCIIYISGPDLYIVDWLSWNNHTENRDCNNNVYMPVGIFYCFHCRTRSCKG